MPIGYVIGMAIGLLICGIMMLTRNSNPTDEIQIAIARSYMRILGYILIFGSLGALIGTAVEYYS
jgi:hypothetical protein